MLSSGASVWRTDETFIGRDLFGLNLSGGLSFERRQTTSVPDGGPPDPGRLAVAKGWEGCGVQTVFQVHS